MKLATRNPATHVSFSRGESIGQLIDAEAGLASLLASLFILRLIFRHIRSIRTWESLDVSVIALFVAEVIQGLGHVMNLTWVVESEAGIGGFCTAQGLIRQIGTTGVALATLTIAVQTFLVIWRFQYVSRRVSVIVILVEIVFLLFLVTIAPSINARKHYEAPAPYWCWISSEFPRERIGLEYFWLWLALFGSILLYVPLFLLHFRLIPTGERWYMPRAELNFMQYEEQSDHRNHRISYPLPLPMCHADAPCRMDLRLWSFYPITYIIVVLPATVVHFIGFREQKVTGRVHTRPAVTIFVATLFALSATEVCRSRLPSEIASSDKWQNRVQAAPDVPLDESVHGDYDSSGIRACFLSLIL